MANRKRIGLGVVSIIFVALIGFSGCGNVSEPAKETKKPIVKDNVSKPAPQKQEPQTVKTIPEMDWTEPELAGSGNDIVAWRYNIGSVDCVINNNDKVYATCGGKDDGRIVCLDIFTGKMQWTGKTMQSKNHKRQIVSNGKVIISYWSGYESGKRYQMAANDSATGEKLWETKNTPYITTELTFDNNKILFVTSNNLLNCVDAANGSPIWTQQLPSTCAKSVVTSNGKLLISAEKSMLCYDEASGKKLWQFDTGNIISEPSVSANGKVCFGSVYDCNEDTKNNNDIFYCVNFDSGKEEFSIKLDLPLGETPIIINDSQVLLVESNQSFYCINLEQKKVEWRFDDDYICDFEVFDGYLWVIKNKISEYSIDLKTGVKAEKNEKIINFDLPSSRIVEIIENTVQCRIYGSRVINEMFASSTKTRLQRLLKDNKVYISDTDEYCENGTPDRNVFAYTSEKRLWEAPNTWALKPIDIVNSNESYFLSLGEKIFVFREENKAILIVCLDKATGKLLWEVEKGDYTIDSFENNTLSLYSINKIKRINVNDGTVTTVDTKLDDKLVLFETALPKMKSDYHELDFISGFTENYLLFSACVDIKGGTGNYFCINLAGNITALPGLEPYSALNIRRSGSKFFIINDKSYQDDNNNEVKKVIVNEVDTVTGLSKEISVDDIPKNAFQIYRVSDSSPKSFNLSKDMIKKIGVQPHKSSEYFSSYMKGINIGNYTICIRGNDEGMEYIVPYYDFTGIYDTKTMKKLWSYEKKIYKYVVTDTAIVLYSREDKAGVMFNDLKTGKTLLKYDKGVLLNKVGDICFLINEGKLIAINLKKLGM